MNNLSFIAVLSLFKLYEYLVFYNRVYFHFKIKYLPSLKPGLDTDLT